MAECAHCGRQLPPVGKFCQGCGKPRAEKPLRAGPPPPVAPVVASAGHAPTSQPPMRLAPAAQPAARQPAGWRILLPSLSRWDVFALIGGAISAAIWYGWSAMDVKDT